MVAIYCYLETVNDKVLKLHISDLFVCNLFQSKKLEI